MLLKSVRAAAVLLFCYVSCLICILASNGAWLYDTQIEGFNHYDALLWCIYIAIGMGILGALLRLQVHRVRQNIWNVAIVLLCVSTFLLMNRENVLGAVLLYFILLLWLVLVFFFIPDMKMLWRAFVHVMVALAAISLFFYVFGSLLGWIPPYKETDSLWAPGSWGKGVKNYYYLYYQSQSFRVSNSIKLIRNCGCFPESPMFVFPLSLAFSAAWLIVPSTPKWQKVVLGITILTTMTTAGILCIFLTFVFYVALNHNRLFKSKKTKQLLVWILIIGVVGAVLIVLGKSFTRSGSGSMNVRILQTLGCLKAWWDHPLFGYGYLNEAPIKAIIGSNQGISMGLPFMLASGGLVLSAVFLIPYAQSLVQGIRQKRFDLFCHDTVFFVLHVVTPLWFRPIFVFYIAYMITREEESSPKQ